MRAGQLDKRIALQRKTSIPSDSGQPTDTWATTTERWADKRPVAGVERYGGQQLEAREQVEFRLRWSNDIADLQATDRIIEPATDAADPPIRSIYEVIAVLELGRHEGFRVITARRTVA
jgi:SPP1 family predicted phage head-tail adaptor